MNMQLKYSSAVDRIRRKMLTVRFYKVYKFLNLVKSSYNRNLKRFSVKLFFMREYLRKRCLSLCVYLFSGVCITTTNVFVHATTEPKKFSYFRNEIHSMWKLVSGFIFAKIPFLTLYSKSCRQLHCLSLS